MLAAPAGSDSERIGEMAAAPRQFDQRFLALLAVNV
jgi:hypothetical protein